MMASLSVSVRWFISKPSMLLSDMMAKVIGEFSPQRCNHESFSLRNLYCTPPAPVERELTFCESDRNRKRLLSYGRVSQILLCGPPVRSEVHLTILSKGVVIQTRSTVRTVRQLSHLCNVQPHRNTSVVALPHTELYISLHSLPTMIQIASGQLSSSPSQPIVIERSERT